MTEARGSLQRKPEQKLTHSGLTENQAMCNGMNLTLNLKGVFEEGKKKTLCFLSQATERGSGQLRFKAIHEGL